MNRNAATERFLVQAGWEGAARTPVAGDASFRRYERLRLGCTTAILMDAPPDHEDVRPFLAIGRLLSAWGYSAPRIFAEDVADGFLLLEDLGDDTLNRVIVRDYCAELQLYELAVDVLVDLHTQRPPDAMAATAQERYVLRSYDAQTLLREARLLPEWYLPALYPAAQGADLVEALDALWRPLLAEVEKAPAVLTLRDYHADNLMWLPEREGLAQLGLLDFQDALAGHRAYDLVSLLQDARRDVPETLEEAMIVRYLSAAAVSGHRQDEAEFRRAYAILGAQRAAKIVGIFSRLARRDGKPRYLSLIPRVWGLLERNLAAARLAALEGWLDDAVPRGDRRKILAA